MKLRMQKSGHTCINSMENAIDTAASGALNSAFAEQTAAWYESKCGSGEPNLTSSIRGSYKQPGLTKVISAIKR